MGSVMFKSVSVVVVSCVFLGCGADRAVNPDGDEHEVKVQSAPMPQFSIAEVIGAVAGVPEHDAPATLERWLHFARGGQSVLAQWPRENGQLDLEHAPVALASIDASIGPGSKSRCGDVVVVFNTNSSAALRMKLTIPATAPACRGLFRASHVTGAEAAPLLRAAIADARVPAEANPHVSVAAN